MVQQDSGQEKAAGWGIWAQTVHAGARLVVWPASGRSASRRAVPQVRVLIAASLLHGRSTEAKSSNRMED